MSNFVHCMVCFVFPSEGVKFYLSSCGHIACVKCVQKGSMTLSCKVCLKDNPQILEINRNLKPELRELFTPLDDFSKIVHEIGQVLDFQDAQRQHLMRHLQTKNNTFDKMQEFCKEEMKKKTQYKEALMRAKVEYKKKCDEIQELKSKLNKMERCSSNLSDLTHDPFRTPMPPGHRSFTTSTPYNNPRHRVEDVTQSTTHGTTHQTDTSTSFSAAGIPLVPMDSGGEVAGLARMTSAMCRDSSSHIQQRSSTVFGSSDRFFQVSETTDKTSNTRGNGACTFTSDDSNSGKTPATKKSRLDIMSRTQPLPMKSVYP